MIKMTLEEIRQKYKRGWYRKGKTYRFLCAIDGMGFLIEQKAIQNGTANSKLLKKGEGSRWKQLNKRLRVMK
ncbi:hypothetical protein ACYRCB_002477 [Enterococcus hirae]